MSENKDRDTINFIHSPEPAQESLRYILAVFGVDDKSHYRLSLKRNETHIPLREGVTDSHYVRNGEDRYYVF